MCCIPTLPSGNGHEAGILGLGVSSKQIQLKECFCKCALNARTVKYIQTEHLQMLHVHVHEIITQNDSTK